MLRNKSLMLAAMACALAIRSVPTPQRQAEREPVQPVEPAKPAGQPRMTKGERKRFKRRRQAARLAQAATIPTEGS